MLNKVMLIGRLGRDPEVRYSQNGAPIANLTIATDESYTDRDGNKQERTEWHKVVAFQRLAENCANYLSKGRLVYVEGSLQTRKWQDQQGQDRYTTEIKAQTIRYLDRTGDPKSSYSEEGDYDQPPRRGAQNNPYGQPPRQGQGKNWDRGPAPRDNPDRLQGRGYDENRDRDLPPVNDYEGEHYPKPNKNRDQERGQTSQPPKKEEFPENSQDDNDPSSGHTHPSEESDMDNVPF